MQTLKLGITTMIFVGGAACSDGGTTVGLRSDGLTVECTKDSDDVSICTPKDGDNRCERWEDGGAAMVLWPPSHALIRFTLDDCAAVQNGCDGGDEEMPAIAADARITSITSDEAIEVGAGGDGFTTDRDAAIVDSRTFDLRSEHQGGGDGRVYRVNHVDSTGVAGSCEFLVPHDRGPTNGAIDSGAVVTVLP